MIAQDFFSYLKLYNVTTYLGLEDFADKVNFLWSLIVLLIAASIVVVRQYFMEPIECYFATVIDGIGAVEYMTSLCWVEGTYPLNWSQPIPHTDEGWANQKDAIMNYYQWVPFVLGLQAILYYLPRLVWSSIVFNFTGLDLQHLIQSAYEAAQMPPENRQVEVNHIVASLQMLLSSKTRLVSDKHKSNKRVTHCCTNRVLPGRQIILIYFIIKLLYAVNGYGQLYIMYAFLRMNEHEHYIWFGYRIITDIAAGRTWEQTLIFPRIGICRQKLLNVASANAMLAQCVLPANMLNEKIYIFLFFYQAVVLLITLFSIPLWLFRSCSCFRRDVHFIRRFLKISNCYNLVSTKTKGEVAKRHITLERQAINNFVDKCLRTDGLFLLRMISMNAGDLVTTNIVSQLFDTYKSSRPTVPEDDGTVVGRQAERFDSVTDIANPGIYTLQRVKVLPTAPSSTSSYLEEQYI